MLIQFPLTLLTMDEQADWDKTINTSEDLQGSSSKGLGVGVSQESEFRRDKYQNRSYIWPFSFPNGPVAFLSGPVAFMLQNL